mmetsp:Transcript_103610/g.299684  ORF Transcript_103610/g.299684 Transcript_103610/m.299684 type:complete len:230 (+) Transcript_103610:121-810(+)
MLLEFPRLLRAHVLQPVLLCAHTGVAGSPYADDHQQPDQDDDRDDLLFILPEKAVHLATLVRATEAGAPPNFRHDLLEGQHRRLLLRVVASFAVWLAHVQHLLVARLAWNAGLQARSLDSVLAPSDEDPELVNADGEGCVVQVSHGHMPISRVATANVHAHDPKAEQQEHPPIQQRIVHHVHEAGSPLDALQVHLQWLLHRVPCVVQQDVLALELLHTHIPEGLVFVRG